MGRSDHTDRSAFVPVATADQLAEIRKLGGHPRDDLSYNQARTAITALRSRARQREYREQREQPK